MILGSAKKIPNDEMGHVAKHENSSDKAPSRTLHGPRNLETLTCANSSRLQDHFTDNRVSTNLGVSQRRSEWWFRMSNIRQ